MLGGGILLGGVIRLVFWFIFGGCGFWGCLFIYLFIFFLFRLGNDMVWVHTLMKMELFIMEKVCTKIY